MNGNPTINNMLPAFLSLLQGEISTQVVWTADLSYWLEGQRRAGMADAAWESETGYLAFHQKLGVLPYYYYAKFWLAESRYSTQIEVTCQVDGDRTLTCYRTPRGELTQETIYLPASCSVGVTKHFVESEDDLDILLYLIEQRSLAPTNLNDYAERRLLWSEYGGLPSIALPRSPLPSLAYEWAGIQNAIYLLADCQEKVQRLLGLMEEQEAPILEAVCRAAPPLVHFADNLTSDHFTRLYDRYLGPTHRKRLGRLHAAGVRCAVHLDGTVRGLLPKLAHAGFDAVEALTPSPAGDLDACDMRRVAGSSRLILWGGVPGVMFAPPFTWKDMHAYIERLLACWRGQPFILGVADQVPPDGDIRFCQKISELIIQA
jgi:hypothetical protein